MTTPDEIYTEIDRIDSALQQETYEPGAFQELCHALNDLPIAERRQFVPGITQLSNRLHRRHRYREAPFIPAYLAEWLSAVLGAILLFGWPSQWLAAVSGVGLLAVSLQPLIKVKVGLLLGVRYAYAYLWYVEPRFKMQYGTYLVQSKGKRVLLHASGALGTPLAALAGALGSDITLLSLLCWIGFALAAAMQVGAFLAETVGIRHLAGRRLSLLTSPATAAAELKQAKRNPPPS